MMLKEDKKHWEEVCKIGQGANCCKYLVMGEAGFECMRDKPENKKVIDDNWTKHPHVAQGENCMGYEAEKNTKKEYYDKRYHEPFEDDGAYAD